MTQGQKHLTEHQQNQRDHGEVPGTHTALWGHKRLSTLVMWKAADPGTAQDRIARHKVVHSAKRPWISVSHSTGLTCTGAGRIMTDSHHLSSGSSSFCTQSNTSLSPTERERKKARMVTSDLCMHSASLSFVILLHCTVHLQSPHKSAHFIDYFYLLQKFIVKFA